LRRGGAVFDARRYLEAGAVFQQGYESAKARGWGDLAARFLGNLGGCRFALHQYEAALEAFTSARGLAEAAGDPSAAGAMDANISSVYEQMGELEAAVTWAQRGADRLAGPDRVKHLPKVLIHLASLRARQGRLEEAAELFREGIAGADRGADLGHLRARLGPAR
jgi:tetratricopeptide (TPR) repeat protein